MGWWADGVCPGGIIKGAYDDPRKLGGHPLFVASTNGCYVTDVDGNEYVDFANHHTTTILGHTPPTVMEAVRASLEDGLAFGHASSLEAEITAELASRVPSVEKVRFTNSGTESSLHVCRMARAITGKQKIAKFEGQCKRRSSLPVLLPKPQRSCGADHGSHDSVEWSVGPASDANGPASSPLPAPSVAGMPDAMADLVVILPWDLEEAEAILRADDDVAAVFYEGNLASALELPGGVAKHCAGVRALTAELGVLLVMDEVVCFRASHAGFQGPTPSPNLAQPLLRSW